MPLVKRVPASLPEVETTDASETGMDELARTLDAGTPSARRAAARELAAYAEAVPLLCAHLEKEPALSVRSVIFHALSSSGDARAVAGLIALLRSEDPHLRNSAIEALQEMPEAIAPHIDALLRDPDSDVRVFTVNILASLRHPNIVAWLRRVLAEDAHVNVCAAAIDAMAEVGGDEDVAPLEAAARRFQDVPFIAYATTAAIRRVRGS